MTPLTVRELSKLSETDLADLSKKLKQTSGWMSSLEEELETAVKIKNIAIFPWKIL